MRSPRQLRPAWGLWMACACLLASTSLSAMAREPGIGRIVPDRLPVQTEGGQGLAALALSADWRTPHPEIEHVVIMVHGRLRNAATYFTLTQRAAKQAGAAGNTLVIAPQFIAIPDVQRHALPDDLLRWRPQDWMDGLPAQGPAPLSSFDVLDAVLLRLLDPANLPQLRDVVVAGHSGGGQTVQRYAVLGRAPDTLRRAGVAVRFVIANPSSYAYFSADRPQPVDPARCPGYDHWKYGLQGLPPYAGATASASLESAYARQPVIYLLGGADTDPNQAALDKRCQAEAQGPTRFDRGQAYYRYLQARHSQDLPQTLRVVPGVGHDAKGMFQSAEGLQALFGDASNASSAPPPTAAPGTNAR